MCQPSAQNPKGSGMLRSVVTPLERGPKAGLGLLVSHLGIFGGWLCALSSTSPSVPLSSLQKQSQGRGDTRGTLGRQAGTSCRGREGREDAELELELDGNCDVPNYRERANHSGAS